MSEDWGNTREPSIIITDLPTEIQIQYLATTEQWPSQYSATGRETSEGELLVGSIWWAIKYLLLLYPFWLCPSKAGKVSCNVQAVINTGDVRPRHVLLSQCEKGELVITSYVMTEYGPHAMCWLKVYSFTLLDPSWQQGRDGEREVRNTSRVDKREVMYKE